MLIKTFIYLCFFITFSFASFQSVVVGKIDKEYSSKITKEELKSIIYEIENIFESQLGFNVFDYSKDGKKIDIIYIPPSKAQKQISRKLESLKRKEKKIKALQEKLPSKKEKVEILKDELSYKNTIVNNKLKNYNAYVRDVNASRLTREQFLKIKNELKLEKKHLDSDIKNLKSFQRKVSRQINKYNNEVNSYNFLIRDFNRTSIEVESLTRGFKKVKGMTFGKKLIEVKTFYKDGKKQKKRTVKNTMDKIEIYGFESINELKAVLAHEIAHLVGIPHINKKGALLNPIMQKNQLENLYLTSDDIKNFKRNF